MNLLKIGALVLAASAIVSCGVSSTETQQSSLAASKASANRDVLKSITATGNMMPGPGRRGSVRAIATLEVTSTGCTKEGSYKVAAIQTSTSVQSIKITRVTPDYCEAMPHRIEIQVPVQGFAPSKKTMFEGKEVKVIKHFVY